MPDTRPTKVVYIIAHRDFRDEEFFIPKEILEKGGIEVKVASFERTPAVGLHEGVAPIDLLVSEVKSGDFNALLMAGGPGIHKHLDDSDLKRIVLEFNESGKILGAICAAPVAFALSGILKGKNATVWKTKDDGDFVRILVKEGAFYHDEPVVQDGHIITSDSPASARQFGQKVLSVIKQKAPPSL